MIYTIDDIVLGRRLAKKYGLDVAYGEMSDE